MTTKQVLDDWKHMQVTSLSKTLRQAMKEMYKNQIQAYTTKLA